MTPSNKISADKILDTNDFSDFLRTANGYCSFIETENKLAEVEFLRMTQAHLISLYSMTRHLPTICLQADKDFESHIDDSATRSIFKLIGDRVPFSYYSVTLNPVDTNNLTETGTGDLIDDLGDIYLDLKKALIIFDSVEIAAKEYAIWKFKFDFDYHWGNHCMDALYAIHHYLDENKHYGW